MFDLDNLDILFVTWAFFFQIVLIVHFALLYRRPSAGDRTRRTDRKRALAPRDGGG